MDTEDLSEQYRQETEAEVAHQHTSGSDVITEDDDRREKLLQVGWTVLGWSFSASAFLTVSVLVDFNFSIIQADVDGINFPIALLLFRTSHIRYTYLRRRTREKLALGLLTQSFLCWSGCVADIQTFCIKNTLDLEAERIVYVQVSSWVFQRL